MITGPVSQWSRRSRLLGTVILLLVSAGAHSGAGLDYPGWSKSFDAKKKATVYRPADPSSDLEVLVKIYPAVLLENLGADRWLLNKLTQSKAPKGKWGGEAEVTRQTANLASGRRLIVKHNGIKGTLDAMAFTGDRQYVRLAVAIYTLEQKNKTYIRRAANILRDIAKTEKANALAQQRGLDLEKHPPKVKGIKTGVPIKPGRYVGTKTKGTKVLGRYEIMLHANGEYEFLGSKDTGRYVYSQATGRLNIKDDFYNSTYEPHREFCVYGVNQQTNKHTIYAE